MTMLERGVCILPEWLANEFIKKMPVKKIQIGAEGLNQKLFAILRSCNIFFIEHDFDFIKYKNSRKNYTIITTLLIQCRILKRVCVTT
jgi:hypothetical protein